jgi:hypothetical protein
MHDASCFIYVLKCETLPGVATLKQKLGAVHNAWWPSETHISHELKMTFKNFNHMRDVMHTCTLRSSCCLSVPIYLFMFKLALLLGSRNCSVGDRMALANSLGDAHSIMAAHYCGKPTTITIGMMQKYQNIDSRFKTND